MSQIPFYRAHLTFICALSLSLSLGLSSLEMPNINHHRAPGTETRCRTVASKTHSTQIGDTHTHSTRSRNSSENYVSMAVMRRNRFMRSIYIIYEAYDFRELATATCHLPPPLLLCAARVAKKLRNLVVKLAMK